MDADDRKSLRLVATDPQPAGPDDDWDADAGAAEAEPLASLPAPLGEKRSERQARKLEAVQREAARVHGTDFVRKLRAIRDPRERIIFVAESVFARKGFGGARTQEIADLAAVNKAMIHYYFDSKEKLYHAVLDKILFDLIKLTQDTSRQDLSYPRMLELFCRGFFDYVATHKNFSRITAMEMGSNDRYLPRLVETFFKPLFDRGVKFIREGIAEGAFRKVEPRQFLVSIYGLTMAYFSDAEFMQLLLGQDPLAEKTLKLRREEVLDLIFAGLGCKRP